LEQTFNHIKRHSLAHEVVQRLQKQISLGEYQCGQKLPSEPELMTHFGVGRSTIREAVRILANAGLVRVQQGTGTFVSSSTTISEPLPQRLKRAKAANLNEVRLLLELKIAEKAALYRQKKDIRQMEAFLRKRKEKALAGEFAECIAADIGFHTSIARASQNDVLADLYTTFADQLRQSFADIYVDTKAFLQTQAAHESLLQSIIRQEPKQAWKWAEKIALHQFENLP
jgi:DNA-binding FadR family transcriptional regulator